MRVLAALSGGVDSAVAAARAVEAGHEVTAVHMALSADQQQTRCSTRGCCTIEDAQDAARAAAHLGIPFYVWDLAEEFERTVVSDFLAEYRAGRTPNPCVRCNEFVKFAELLGRAQALGFDAVCTGHYARVFAGPHGMELHRAADLLKDQSYVLAVMGRENLARAIFPLGEVASKAEVRAEAAQRGLTVSDKPDSYDICFIPDGDTQGYLRRALGEQTGEIIDPDGKVLGEHRGYHGFTIGQRKGLGLTVPAADGRPRYVLETRPETNQVVVGSAELLTVNRIAAGPLVWLAENDDPALAGGGATTDGGEMSADTFVAPITVQVRAHGQPVTAILEVTEPAAALGVVEEDNPAGQDSFIAEVVAHITGQERGITGMRGIAPGQSLVIYRGTRVLGQATVLRAWRE